MLGIINTLNKQKAFTLAEILVVIAVIGLLSSIIFAITSGTREQGKIAKGLYFSQHLHNSLGSYAVGTWNFDEGSGTTANDTSGWGSNGALVNSPVWRCASTDTSYTPSSQGCSLEFNGENSYLSIPSSQVFAVENMTISAWIKANDFAQWRGLVYIYEDALSDYLIIRNNGTTLQLLIEDDNLARVNLSPPSPGTGTWAHIVFVQDGTGWKYYENGTQETLSGTNSGYATDHLTINSVRIGYGAWASQYFNGLIDEVRIYSTALTSAQIASRYYAGLDRLSANGLMGEKEYRERLAKI
jgi:prepilin-type N-terminal cleavage/methylation domain-containing protein